MSDNIKILLSDETTQKELHAACSRLINIYELSLTRKEILGSFILARRGNSVNNQKRYFFLFDTLLNNNKNMFVAIIKFVYAGWYALCFVSIYPPYNFSSHFLTNNSTYCPKIYKSLLNYYDFDVTNLGLAENHVLKIQKYRNKKYGGQFSKLAQVNTNEFKNE